MTTHTVRWAVASSLLVGFCLSWPSWVGPRASERDGLSRDRVQTEAEAAAVRREFYDRGGRPNPQLDRKILPLKAMGDERFLVSLSDTIQDGLERADFPRVIVIGIDGMGANNVWRDTYRDVPPPAIPNINQLKDTGAYSLRAKIDPLNFSGPNWAGMVTGSDSSEHGVESNDCTRGAALPTIYEVLHEAFPEYRLAVVHEWTRIACYYDPTSVEFRIRTADEWETADWVIKTLGDESVIFTFVHFDDLDRAGHDHGGNSVEYKEKMEVVDHQIGRILEAIATSPRAAETYVILTADHGHLPDGGGHASSDEPVPVIVNGPGVVPGELDFEIRNNQIAPLVAHIFGVAPSPAWSAPLTPFDIVVVR